MGQVLHGSARTTEAIRRAIQHSHPGRLTRHPRADRSNRLEPWGRDDETELVIAPFGISPVSGTPRLIPATIGSMRNQPPKRERSGSMAAYSSVLTQSAPFAR
jgi:hypothetical protein